MGVKERKARQKRLLRQEILDAASELFVREGFENVSLRRIADKIEYSPTTIYLYFRDKAELLESVCQETFGRLTERFTKMTLEPAEPLEALKRGLLAYVEFGLENPHHYRAVFMMRIPEGMDPKKQISPDSPGMQAFDFMRHCVRDCISAGKLRVKDVELASQVLWAGIHGITSLLITHQHFPWAGREKIIRTTVETLVKGLG